MLYLSLLAAILVVQIEDTRPSIEALMRAAENRSHQYHDMRFRFQVKRKVDGFSSAFQEEFLLLAPLEKISTRPRRRWIQSVEKPDGQMSISNFVAVDGIKLHQFQFVPSENGKNWNRRGIVSGEHRDAYDPNILERFLVTDLNGVPEFSDIDHATAKSLNRKFELIGSEQKFNRTVYHLLGAPFRKGFPRLRIHVTAPPQSLIVLFKTEHEGPAAGKSDAGFSELVVDEIGTLDSVLYPKSGRFTQKPVGAIPAIDFAFSDVRAERVKEFDNQTFFPEWPAGTIVVDHIENRQFSTLRAP